MISVHTFLNALGGDAKNYVVFQMLKSIEL